VKGDEPSDSPANERWLGGLPMELVFATVSGRVVVASDPLSIWWALGPAAVLVRPGCTQEPTAALHRLRDAVVCADLGERARHRALAVSTLAAVALSSAWMTEAVTRRSWA